MLVLQVGPKNYPPSHGGVEKVVFDITELQSIDFHILTEWGNEIEDNNVTQLPNGMLKQFSFLLNFTRRHEVDIVHLHKETFALHALLLSLSGRRTILTFHGLAWRIKRWNLMQRSALFFIDFMACLVLKNIVFVSKTDCSFYKKIFFWKSFNYIPNGTNNIGIQSEVGDKRIPDTLCYLGRISPEKNILNLIAAAERFEIDLHLYGPLDKNDPEFSDSFTSALEASSFVKWKGSVEYHKVGETLSKYYSFINPSYSEGMPVSVLEAGANGCYLILSDIPQHISLNYPSATYISCKNIDLSNCLKIEASMENIEYTKENFSLENMKSKYRQLYEKVNG